MTRVTRIAALTIAVSTLLAFGTHVGLQAWEDRIASGRSELFDDVNEDKYAPVIVLIAGATGIFPVIASFLVLLGLWDKLPGRSWWAKGLLFTLLLLILKSALVRQTVMGVVVGVPAWYVRGRRQVLGTTVL